MVYKASSSENASIRKIEIDTIQWVEISCLSSEDQEIPQVCMMCQFICAIFDTHTIHSRI